jgi:hypothetical protein
MLVAVLLCGMSAACKPSQPEIPHISSIGLKASRGNIRVGESVELRAVPHHLAGGSGLRWMVEPKTGIVTPDKSNGAIASFRANEPGTYAIKVVCQMLDGSTVWSNTEKITVGAAGAATAPAGHK